jgi:hypothetical protein
VLGDLGQARAAVGSGVGGEVIGEACHAAPSNRPDPRGGLH